MSVADVVYLLCAITSLACGVLLLRGYRRSRARLLLWSGLCFLGLFLNNAFLFIDLRLVPDVDLEVLRLAPALVGMGLLLYGLIWGGRSVRATLVIFLGGMLATAYLVAALFFLRFWRDSHDRLFAIFAVAFGLLALQRVMLGLDVALVEDDTWYYGIRLLAFLLMLYAIVDKNRHGRDAS